MTRRLFLSAFSLLLFIGTCVLWVRSQFRADHAVFATAVHPEHSTTCTLRIYTGYVGFWINRYTYPASGHRLVSIGAFRGRTHPLYSWAVTEARISPSEPGTWRDRAAWNVGLPRATWEREPPSTMWDVTNVACTRVTADIPFWMVALATAAPPTASFLHWRRKRSRVRRTLCPSCGYDLRATPHRCPECGHAAIG